MADCVLANVFLPTICDPTGLDRWTTIYYTEPLRFVQFEEIISTRLQQVWVNPRTWEMAHTLCYLRLSRCREQFARSGALYAQSVQVTQPSRIYPCHLECALTRVFVLPFAL